VIGNGAGLRVTGEIVKAEPALLELTDEVAPEPRLVLVQALAKGDRDELAVQAATELGVDGVVPWTAQRSISRWEGAKVAKGHARWEAITREATKQSLRSWLPEVGELVTSKQLAALAADTHMIVLDPTGDVQLTELDADGRDVVLVVGPEGGITPAELDLLRGSGATIARLGSTVLRTSTAGPAAIAVLNAKLGRW
ncbi:MAG: 16S rRNA (uracil(1498)-N(3))-methyltransferase, partial [Glaciihabitans sp.]